VPIEISNTIDRPFKIVVYTVARDDREDQAARVSPADIEQFTAEGTANFNREGYIEAHGIQVKQAGAFTTASVQGRMFVALFEMFMSRELFDEHMLRNSPGVVIGCSVTNQDQSRELYYGYHVSFLDEAGKLVARGVKTADVEPGSGSFSNDHINLSPGEIARIRHYKISFYESEAKISESVLEEN
jgi:hypothetical protein